MMVWKWLVVISSVFIVFNVAKCTVGSFEVFSTTAASSAGETVGSSIGYGMGSYLLSSFSNFRHSYGYEPLPPPNTNFEYALEVAAGVFSLVRRGR